MNKQIILDTVYSVIEKGVPFGDRGVAEGVAEAGSAEDAEGGTEEEVIVEEGVAEADASLEDGSTWAEKGLFVVNIACKGVAGDEIEVLLDCDGVKVDAQSGVQSVAGVRVDDCVAISRQIVGRLHEMCDVIGADGEIEKEADFSITVMSSGLGQPLKVGRQYRKLMIRASLTDGDDACQVDVLFKDGRKLTGVSLCGLGYSVSETEVEDDMPTAIEVLYEVKELVEGKKRKELVEYHEQIELKDVKAVTEHFNFK